MNSLNMLPRDVAIADAMETLMRGEIARHPASDASGEDDAFASGVTILELLIARLIAETPIAPSNADRWRAANMVGNHLLMLTEPSLNLRPGPVQ